MLHVAHHHELGSGRVVRHRWLASMRHETLDYVRDLLGVDLLGDRIGLHLGFKRVSSALLPDISNWSSTFLVDEVLSLALLVDLLVDIGSDQGLHRFNLPMHEPCFLIECVIMSHQVGLRIRLEPPRGRCICLRNVGVRVGLT